jgi:spore maturation protein CgeB
MFGEDELAFYTTADEACEKAKHYLEHEDERQAMAARAQAKTRREHSLRKRLTDILEIVGASAGD